MPNEGDLKALVQKRGSFKTKLTLFERYLSALKLDDSDRCDVIELNQRISRIEVIIDEFESTQCEIECESEDIEAQIKEREEFENKYHSLLSKAKMLLERFEINNDTQTAMSSESKDTKGMHVRNQVAHEKLQGVILPEIQIPKFNGSYDTWLEFRDLFTSLIHSSDQLSDIQKYHYLRGALVESAPQVIQSIEFVGENYTTAWDTLCERFNNKNLLINNHLKAIFQMENVTVSSASKIRFLHENLCKHLSCLRQLGEPTDSWDTLLIYIISNKLDKQSAQEWEKHKFNLNSVNLGAFKEFLKKRACMLETVDSNLSKYDTKKYDANKYETKKYDANKYDTKKYDANSYLYKKNEKYSNTNSLFEKSEHLNDNSCEKSYKSKFDCVLCKGKHKLFYCPEFLKLSIKERYAKVQSLKLCENCLRPYHVASSCKWSGCKICSKLHNTILCDITAKNSNQSDSNEKDIAKINCTLATAQSTIISTAQVKVYGLNTNTDKNIKVRAMLDSGSQSSFITTQLCEKLKLKKSECKLAIHGISENISYAKYKCDINIKSQNESFSFELSCFVLDNITSDMPEFPIDINSFDIPSGITLADEEFYIPQRIDILIGADAFWRLLCVGQINLGVNSPILQNTKLGPISMPKYSLKNKTRCNLSRDVSIVQQQLSKFGEIEEIENGKSKHSVEEEQCESHFTKHTSINEHGRFIVSIPLKQSTLSLGESRDHALKRFLSLEKRLYSEERLKNMYIDFLNEYEKLGHMTDVTNSVNEKPEYYMPHHGVLKESSTSTKLRVVFNASAPTSNGLSFNELQMTGPTIQQDILSIILRFRLHPIALSSDIKMMYRQILIEPKQRSLQKILWRSDPREPIKTYQLNTVTYGTTSASFLAIRCLFEVADKCENEHPLIAKIIRNDMYVDDLLTSVDSEEQAKYVYTTLSKILQNYGFELLKWKSNQTLIFNTQNTDPSSNLFEFTLNKESKILGLSWHCDSDLLTYTIQTQIIKTEEITKRHILSRIATIFDPFGLCSPCIIIAKILLQKLWSEKLSWDDVLPKTIIDYWLEFSSDLRHLNDLQISRKVICPSPIYVTLHGFADASETSYGACIYVVSKNAENNIISNLLCAKSKVAPIKPLTIPKLEHTVL